MMRILLTGGSGMVGMNIRESIHAKDHNLAAPGSSELNLLNFKEVVDYIDGFYPDVIIHAAGCVGGIQANMKEPVRFLVENMDMGRNIVLAAKTVGTPALINLGSSCMYPRDALNPLSENAILQGELEPTNEGYALAKIVTAKLCEYIKKEDSAFNYKTLIPCNLYGRYDSFEPQKSHMIPAVIDKMHEAVAEGRDTVEIWGDGEARREFMYAEDLADCVWMAVRDIQTLPDVMNVGLGLDYSVNEYYEAAAQIIGFDGGFHHDLSKPVGMKKKLVDVSLATEWGWSAKTSLLEGLRKTYDFYLNEGKNL